MTVSVRMAQSLAAMEAAATRAWRAGRRNSGALLLACQLLRAQYRAPSPAAIKYQAEVFA